MNNSLRQLEKTPRQAFTLVELLVAVGILVILTTLTVTAFTVNDADRVNNSIATFKNALEGARSRAIKSGAVAGLRLILDPQDNHLVKSMVYVGSAGMDEGTGSLIFDATNRRWLFINDITDDTQSWGALMDKNMIAVGSRIEIPANSGSWFTITGSTKNNNSTNNEVVFLSGHYYPSQPSGTNSFKALPQDNLQYRLELPLTILAGSKTILLDQQTCIDLDGSRLPTSWRALEDKNNDRAFDSSGSDVDVDNDGMFDYVGGYFQNQLQILFGPDGNITSDLRTTGVIGLRFAYVSDVAMIQAAREIDQSATFPGNALFPTYSQFMLPANPEKAHKALVVLPQTGAIIVSDIDPTTPTGGPTTGFNNRFASQPFSFALLGKESN